MALNANKVKGNNNGPKAPLLDEGAYPARLVAVIDLGLQPQQYNGEAKPPKVELQTIYELSDEFMPGEDGEPDETKPRWMWDSFPLNNLNSEKAKSTARYYALDPNEENGGDWSKLLGAPVIVAITKTKGRDNNEYNNVGGTSTMRAKEAAKLPDLVNDPILFDMDNPDLEVFLALPQRLQDKIKESLSFGGSKIESMLDSHKGGGKAKENPTKKDTAPDVKSGVEKTASLGSSEGSSQDDDNEW
jgi:hypothetical protein